MGRTHILYYWPFVREIYRSPADPHDKGLLQQSFDAFNFMLARNKLLNKPLGGLWFEAPWRSSDVTVITIMWQCRIHLIIFISCYALIWWERRITCKPWDDGETSYSNLSMHSPVFGGIGVDLSYLPSSVKRRC